MGGVFVTAHSVVSLHFKAPLLFPLKIIVRPCLLRGDGKAWGDNIEEKEKKKMIEEIIWKEKEKKAIYEVIIWKEKEKMERNEEIVLKGNEE